MTQRSILDDFHPAVRVWFLRTYSSPTPPQELGWPHISAGRNTLILAPTGSGKTLAAFLWAINHVVELRTREHLGPGIRILYISPLKALNNDIERNLRAPLAGIYAEGRNQGVDLSEIHAAVRTGDTSQAERQAMLRHPPDILITTPESLYLMLTSAKQRALFRSVQYVIVDEIHSVCNNKRGVHLSLSLERLQHVADQEFVRIGLSATQRPLPTIAAYLGGLTQNEHGILTPRQVDIVDAGQKKSMDIRVVCPVPDFSFLPEEGAWPSIFSLLHEEIARHTTTLVFVNNRRLAERIAAKLNLMATRNETAGASGKTNLYAALVETSDVHLDNKDKGTPDTAVQAYHGSMAKEARESMESALKGGRLRALVATSSLELGIDIGSIDLVIQVESPKGIARGLQRIGRSGHLVHATSKGRIVPTFREDLVEAAVVAKAICAHDVEPTVIPDNCLDVLAQQIVAMVAVEEWNTDDLFELVRRSYCYRVLTRPLFDNVLSMLAGHFSDDALGDLRAKISWDTVGSTLRPLPGTSHLAITSGGTIADRGYFGVYLEDARIKVGEIDEEFVYESRPGDRFILGSTVWAIKTIDTNRVIVTPAPGQPARMPFWKGEGIGRSVDLGEQVGQFRRTVAGRIDQEGTLEWLQSEYPLDVNAAWNILDYFRRQRDATTIIPDDTTLLVERTRDEAGDLRVIVHSSFGRRVNGLFGLLLAKHIRDESGNNPEMLYNDDGILLRVPDERALSGELFSAHLLSTARETVLDEVLSSPLFAGQFRQNAARALLMPRPRPGKRTPLWVQRIRAGDLLQLVRTHENFPIVLETIREVLQDILDLPRFLSLIEKLQNGTMRVENVSTEIPSPFATGLLFAFIGASMYSGDAVPDGGPSSRASVDSRLLNDMIAGGTAASALRPEAVATVEARLQHETQGFQARSPEELMQIFLRVGDLDEAEILTRCAGDALAFVRSLHNEKRIVKVSLGEHERWIPAEYAEIYRQPDQAPHAEQIVRRYLQGHGPVRTSDLARRYGLHFDHLSSLQFKIIDGENFLSGRFSGNEEDEWCSRRNVDQIRRQTITILRKEISPVSLRQFTLFLQKWTGLHDGGAGSDPLSVLDQFQGLPLPIESWERDIVRLRSSSRDDSSIAASTRDGTIIWIGQSGGRVVPVFRGNGSHFFHGEAIDQPLGHGADRVREFLSHHGASFFSDIRGGTGLSLDALNTNLAELFWSGTISNDVYPELLALKRSVRDTDRPIEPIRIIDPKHNPARGAILGRARRAFRQVPGWSGRWFSTHDKAIEGEPLTEEQRASIQARQLLVRYGIFAREFLTREVCLSWSALWPAFQLMELRGEIRRGYFVEGLSGMQYALPEAAEELRSIQDERAKDKRATIMLLASCDPSNPYGPGIVIQPDPDGEAFHFSRSAGNYVAFLDGGPIVVLEAYGSRIITVGDPPESSVEQVLREFTAMLRLPESVRPFKEIVIEYWNGERPAALPVSPMLRRLGFQRERNQTVRIDAYAL